MKKLYCEQIDFITAHLNTQLADKKPHSYIVQLYLKG